MSKDKGSKNVKKAPADKSQGKSKATSDYKTENKGKNDKAVTPQPLIPKGEPSDKKR